MQLSLLAALYGCVWGSNIADQELKQEVFSLCNNSEAFDTVIANESVKGSDHYRSKRGGHRSGDLLSATK
jgi:hypothetical protein